jgi:hypothetical protein
MKAQDIGWLKEFLAAERGVSPAEISSSEALSSYRKRRRMLWIGFIMILSVYLSLRILYNTTAGRIFVTLVTAVSTGLCVLEAVSTSPLSPGGKLAVRTELSSFLSINRDQITDEYVRQYGRWDWRNLVFGLLALAAVGLAFDWIWPKNVLNPLLEVLLLFVFWFAGRVAWKRQITRSGQRHKQRRPFHGYASTDEAAPLGLDQNMPETQQIKSSARGCLDIVFLIGVALLLCVVGVGAFWAADAYHVNPMWVFFLWNSVFMVPIFMKDFRNHLKRPTFVAFLIIWGVIHGLVVVMLMRRTPVVVWLLAISVELFLGYLLADRIFGIRRATRETTE